MATNKNAQKETASQDAHDQLVTTWQTRLEAAKEHHKPAFDQARENYQIWYAQTPEGEKTTDQWRSNVFLPILPGKGRDAKAKLSILEPRFKVIPTDAWDLNKKTGKLTYNDDALVKSMKISKKLNRDFISYTTTGGLPPRASIDYAETDAIVAGWGLALAPLKTYRKIYKLRQALKDADGNDSAYIDQKAAKITKKILRMSTELVTLDIFRTYGSPKMKSWEETPWLITEKEQTYHDLAKANSTKGEMVYDLPDELKTAKSAHEKNEYSTVRDEALGYSIDGSEKKDDTVDTFLVYDCYDAEKGRFYTFVEAKVEGSSKGWIKIRDIANPYDHGLIPLIPFYIKRRPHSPWGESFFAISKDLQYAYNSSFNQFSDNATLSTETMAIVDKRSIVTDYEIGPGKAIEYDSLDGEKPEPWKFTDPNPAVLNARMEILEKNVEYGTNPQYTSGQVDSSMDKTNGTRGGIEMMLEMANDRLSEMYRELKCSLLRYGHISLYNAQQFQNYIEVLDTPDMSASGEQSIRKGERSAADVLTPMDLQDLYDVDVDDESLLPMTKSERRKLYKEFVDTLLAIHKASVEQAEKFDSPEDVMRLDYANISKEIGGQYGELNAPAFILEPQTRDQINQKKQQDAVAEQQATEQAKQVAAQNNPGADIEQTPNGLQVQYQKRELGNIDKYPADVQNEAYQSLGYQPSQLLQEQAKSQLAEAKSAQLDTQVKEEMVAAASSGKIDPETLSKFIKK